MFVTGSCVNPLPLVFDTSGAGAAGPPPNPKPNRSADPPLVFEVSRLTLALGIDLGSWPSSLLLKSRIKGCVNYYFKSSDKSQCFKITQNVSFKTANLGISHQFLFNQNEHV